MDYQNYIVKPNGVSQETNLFVLLLQLYSYIISHCIFCNARKVLYNYVINSCLLVNKIKLAGPQILPPYHVKVLIKIQVSGL